MDYTWIIGKSGSNAPIRVHWLNLEYNNFLVLSITYGSYDTTKITEKDNDELTVRVKGLKNGNTYIISGVTNNDTGSNKTLTGTLIVVDED